MSLLQVMFGLGNGYLMKLKESMRDYDKVGIVITYFLLISGNYVVIAIISCTMAYRFWLFSFLPLIKRKQIIAIHSLPHSCYLTLFSRISLKQSFHILNILLSHSPHSEQIQLISFLSHPTNYLYCILSLYHRFE